MIKLLILAAVAVGTHVGLGFVEPSYEVLHYGVCLAVGLAAMSRVR